MTVRQKINLNVPESFDDITLNQWKRLLKLQMESKIENELDLYKMRIAQLHILNPDVTEDELKRLSLSQLTDYFKSIQFLDLEQPVKENQKQIIVDGKTYRFNHFKNMSLEQWIDAEKWTDIEDCHKLISIFYLNANDYNNIEQEKIADWLDRSPAHVGFWTISQFFFIQKSLEIAINLYSEQMIQRAKKVERVVYWSKKINQAMKRFGLTFYTK
jgi:hypothetical protein